MFCATVLKGWQQTAPAENCKTHPHLNLQKHNLLCYNGGNLPFLFIMPNDSLTQSLFKAAKQGDAAELERLIQRGDLEEFYSYALTYAVANDHLDCVKMLAAQCLPLTVYRSGLVPALQSNHSECANCLLSVFTQPFDCEDALEAAATHDNVEMVKKLLVFCDPNAEKSAERSCKPGSLALVKAVANGHTEIFELLWPHFDPQDFQGLALYMAAKHNRVAFFERLLPMSDPGANHGAALRIALERGHLHLAELLYPYTDLQKAIQYVKDCRPEWYEEFAERLFFLEARVQKNMLNAHIVAPPASAGRKM